MSQASINRRVLAAALGALLALDALALAGPRDAASAVKPGTLSVSLKTPVSQQKLLSSGKVRARVGLGLGGSLKVVAGVLPEGGSSAKPITKTRVVRFRELGSKKTVLRLSARGRSLLGDCSAKSLVVATRPIALAQSASTPVAAAKTPIVIDSASCAGGQGNSGSGGNGGGGGTPNGNVIPPPQPYTGPAIDTSNADRCDFLDPALCLQPWPNDYFTVADPNSDTGRRMHLDPNSTPANKAGVHISTAELNRNDGFSPGNMIIARIPGLDNPQALENTGAVTVDHQEAYSDSNQPVVVINADTGQRQPIWTEIDYNPIDPAKGHDPDSPGDRAKVNLIIRPAVNFQEGGHYIVALRDLRDDQDDPIGPTNAFRVYRDNLITTDPAIEDRRAHMEDLFAKLGAAGIQRSSLYLTWDFTVASERNLSERMLHIRDDAFHELGDDNLADGTIQGNSPAFSIDGSQTQNNVNANIARIVHGTVTVPCYMNTPGCSPAGSTYNYNPAELSDPDRLPTQTADNTASVAFECIIPHSALDSPGHAPARISLYGHGLLGSASEVEGDNVEAMANEHNIIFCATDWYGFATSNVPNILLILQDVSQFPLLADETQQGLLNFLYLGRLAIHPQGLDTNAAFDDGDGHSVINSDQLLYDGNSQGGILGGALTALAPDFRRAVLGVPAMNYSTLLERSVDFEPYAEGQFTSTVCDLFPSPLKEVCNLAPGDTPLGLYDNYPNELERPLIFSLMQMLWDRAEPDGYAQHMTLDPLPNTPTHTVLMDAAFGDHQVANVAAEVEARTIGARIYQPAFDPGRYWNANGVFGIPAIQSFPYNGSALIYWDGGPVRPDGSGGFLGTATPPNEDIPPRPTYGCGMTGPPACGNDPHSYPRNDVKARAQKSDFLQLGVLNNYCTTANLPDPAPSALVPNTGTAIPCYSHGWTGP
jgi:hypothetical protein